MACATLSSLDYIFKDYYVDYAKYEELLKKLRDKQTFWDDEARKWTARIEREYNRKTEEVVENEFGIVSP